MPSSHLFKYSKAILAGSQDSLPEKLHHGQTEHLLGESQLSDWQNNGKPRWKTITLRACEMIGMFVCILMFGLGLRWQLNADQYCLEHQSSYSPALKQIDNRLHLVQFNGSLSWPSPYRGHPNPELDAEWERLELVYPGSSTLEEVLLSGGTADDARLPEDLGGGYMTHLAVTHQLHCLNLIRKATYYDHYKDQSIEFPDKSNTWRLHIDHCIEMTRQQIMCHADVGLMTSHWIKGYPRPYPNFNTWHKCRNFDEVLALAYKRQVQRPLPDKYNSSWPTVEGSKIWDDAPQPGDRGHA